MDRMTDRYINWSIDRLIERERDWLIWFDLIWFDLIWFDLIWFDLILIWFDLIWFDLIWLIDWLIDWDFVFLFWWQPFLHPIISFLSVFSDGKKGMTLSVFSDGNLSLHPNQPSYHFRCIRCRCIRTNLSLSLHSNQVCGWRHGQLVS